MISTSLHNAIIDAREARKVEEISLGRLFISVSNADAELLCWCDMYVNSSRIPSVVFNAWRLNECNRGRG